MKYEVTRRGAIARGGILLTFIASAGPVMAQAASQFNPPAGPMKLTRKLFRYLFDGKQIVVTRSWAITFEPLARGYQVQGTQISSQVDAPPSLDFLAQLERDRVEERFFPLMIDQYGTIIDPAKNAVGEQLNSQQLNDVIHVARQLVRQTIKETTDQQTSYKFLHQISDDLGNQLNHIPRDLFMPHRLQADETVHMPLPDGKSGTIQLELGAQLAENSHIMRSFQREIITSFDGKVNRSREEWALNPIAPSAQNQ